MKVLGLETSCDETGLAIYDSELGGTGGIVAEVLYSQIELHALYGGVVPELASRDHIRKLVPLLETLLAKAGMDKSELDAVAYTKGPGLIGALMTGALFGRTLAFGLGIPAIGVHHMEGHLLSPLLGDKTVQFPFVCLLVSGGHTMLVRADGIGDYTLLGESIDDAAGECFDKTAKMLGLPYPGGVHIANLAKNGDSTAFDLPRPMLHKGLDFSFSGMKTAVHNLIKDKLNQKGQDSNNLRIDSNRFDSNTMLGDTLANATDTASITADICASFEWAMVETLAYKCVKALQQTKLTQLVIAGGVSANQRLRQTLQHKLEPMGASVHYAPQALCTDNGAMIAYAGCCRLKAGESDDLAVGCVPRWDMASLSKI